MRLIMTLTRLVIFELKPRPVDNLEKDKLNLACTVIQQVFNNLSTKSKQSLKFLFKLTAEQMPYGKTSNA